MKRGGEEPCFGDSGILRRQGESMLPVSDSAASPSQTQPFPLWRATGPKQNQAKQALFTRLAKLAKPESNDVSHNPEVVGSNPTPATALALAAAAHAGRHSKFLVATPVIAHTASGSGWEVDKAGSPRFRGMEDPPPSARHDVTGGHHSKARALKLPGLTKP